MTGDTAALRELTRRVPAVAAPCRVHAQAAQIDTELAAWAVRMGLAGDRRHTQHAAFAALAARAFAEQDAAEVLLFAKWLTALVRYDDLLDDGSAARSPLAVEATCGTLLATLSSGTIDAAAAPVVRAIVPLWLETTARAGPAWPRRFLDSLTRHRRACRRQAVHRRHNRRPTLRTYPALRRRASGAFFYDLVEPILGVDLPEPLARSGTWRSLTDATGDIVAWCNDIASLTKDLANADPHNHILIAQHELGLDRDAATTWVRRRIEDRINDLTTLARALPAEFHRLTLDPAAATAASKVACVLLGAPRGTIEWLLLSQRYAVPQRYASVAG